MSNDEIKDFALQFLREVYKMSENNDFPIRKYDVGNKLGFDPDKTSKIVDYLKEKQLIYEHKYEAQHAVPGNLEIAYRGKEIASVTSSID